MNHETDAPIKERVSAIAERILAGAPGGMKQRDLTDAISPELPGVKREVIRVFVGGLPKGNPRIERPERGIYRLRENAKPERRKPVPKESPFWGLFAEWLEEQGECTRAIALGGASFGSKWGTPDVVGIWKYAEMDLVKLPVEIVSAEVKTNSQKLIEAFGQACSYKLFSHKSYVVIPRESGDADIERLRSLCQIFGIGLVVFDSNDSKNPQFEILVSPRRDEPDIFYVNENMKKASIPSRLFDNR